MVSRKNNFLKPMLLAINFFSTICCQSIPPTNQQANNERFNESFNDRFKLINFQSENQINLENDGPFSYQEALDQIITLAPNDRVIVDMFIPSQIGTSPLALFIHGNKFSKSAHKLQAQYLASWGFHVMTIDAPNISQWLENGHRLKKIVKMIYNVPSLISPKIDRNKIILIGHSFGGSAVITAAAQGAPIRGLILLDPAVYDDIIIDYQKMVTNPVIVLGADPKVFRSKRRSTFSENITAPFAEVSVLGATHVDAQYPTMDQISSWAFDSQPQLGHQKTFKKLILASAISLVSKNLQAMLNSYFQKQEAEGKLTIDLSRLEPKQQRLTESKSFKRSF